MAPSQASTTEPSVKQACLEAWRERRIDALALGAALTAVPVSIAVSEIFLGAALLARIVAAIRVRQVPSAPWIIRVWLVWAGLELVSWFNSPRIAAGTGEIRHLFLIAALFFLIPALDRASYKTAVWRCIFITASAGSIVLAGGFVVRMIRYRQVIAAGGDSSFYLRSGGLLHHWMIFAVVEIMVFAALLEYHAAFPEHRRWVMPSLAINGLAILLSLTRALWIGCFLLWAIHLAWRRSKWIWVVPIVPALAFLLAPAAIRHRVVQSLQPDYYSNTERIQMWRVGAKMIAEHPVFGVGAGRVDELYTSYLAPGEPVPAYHGHLHDDALQLAAQFGLPVLAAAMLYVAVLVWQLFRALQSASECEDRFLCRTALLGLTGFLLAGLTDYSYGHALGLILVSFVTLAPLDGSLLHQTERVHLADRGATG
ncbi:MAG TPA: O-antigen ligase family protein [Bryobacteraceae bacterium]|nr:O-antigen ligase family protein [Bryobacteraceae bacterium]